MRTRLIVIMTTLFFLVPTAASAAEEVSVPELIELAAELAGEEVVVEGELVGDYGFRGNGWMWTQLNGDVYATHPIREGGTPTGGNSGIGIRMRSQLADGLEPPGRYGSRGPLVRVTGTWRYHDPGRQGESYLQVEALSVIEPGRDLPQGAQPITVFAGLALLAGASVLWWARSGRP